MNICQNEKYLIFAKKDATRADYKYGFGQIFTNYKKVVNYLGKD